MQRLAQKAISRSRHERRVARIALSLFDQMLSLHQLDLRARSWLEAASLLHDVGKTVSNKAHHKASLRTILRCETLPFGKQERLIVGLIARYHRGAPPRASHRGYRDLDSRGRQVVRTLASLLRLADGLDRTWGTSLRDLHCRILPEAVVLILTCRTAGAHGRRLPRRKTFLFESQFASPLTVQCRQGPRPGRSSARARSALRAAGRKPREQADLRPASARHA
jgi:exopolyphosphatase/guanosine-5'-triphosphate,3'-diphosphate pyrophosphatase